MRTFCNFIGADTYSKGYAQGRWKFQVNRYVVLYLATLVVLLPIDFLFLGALTEGLFTAQVGDMLGGVGFFYLICFTWRGF